MRNRYFLYTGMALILVVLVIAIFVFSSPPDEDEQDVEVAAALPTAVAETEQPTLTPIIPEEEPAVEPTEEPQEPAPRAAESDSSAESAAVTPEMEEYVSMTEFFSLKFPAGWRSQEPLPGATFTMANSDSALEHYNAGTDVASGDLILNIGFLPYALLRQRELSSLDIQFEAPPDVFLASLMPMFRVDAEAQMSGPELVTLPDGRDAGKLTVAEEGREGLILVFGAGDGVIAVVSAVSAPGEMADLQEITNMVAAEVTFSGAQDALYGILLGG